MCKVYLIYMLIFIIVIIGVFYLSCCISKYFIKGDDEKYNLKSLTDKVIEGINISEKLSEKIAPTSNFTQMLECIDELITKIGDEKNKSSVVELCDEVIKLLDNSNVKITDELIEIILKKAQLYIKRKSARG